MWISIFYSIFFFKYTTFYGLWWVCFCLEQCAAIHSVFCTRRASGWGCSSVNVTCHVRKAWMMLNNKSVIAHPMNSSDNSDRSIRQHSFSCQLSPAVRIGEPLENSIVYDVTGNWTCARYRTESLHRLRLNNRGWGDGSKLSRQDYRPRRC